ncbi:hypothetical protein VFPPC_16336 [Pochonia chlamydosporia 170]|uniref:Uncharacterized protein n=1 Tax=Pochonia chlamydosporia 170 TaxID=1380566 RepID=A0A179FJC4_METCM|nr:hypothetical protein VFPPC_16336 [Pochonia chlamydosporia 170]OAQ65350.1 hypothetical protein VFPPC_16336 [Pochonia chlamydosporia 170]
MLPPVYTSHHRPKQSQNRQVELSPVRIQVKAGFGGVQQTVNLREPKASVTQIKPSSAVCRVRAPGKVMAVCLEARSGSSFLSCSSPIFQLRFTIQT